MARLLLSVASSKTVPSLFLKSHALFIEDSQMCTLLATSEDPVKMWHICHILSGLHCLLR